ncbi:3-phosphoshikimate 1-carboxyvinyltransferase [Methanobacterium alcaliphilum]|uniref:3-phosphoshikimate 1-carboxyvinyltransferase n=1 Tax=Methanobacterium alcaliphilum TaxID=392018 RepID=UPI00200A997B|nr:3-phosphoshikimate 1-carboxyvinyltransferase [Methanobacterium alcaliphilum]MCK9150819.1 3-phosphoshikimate 1-carboxyvinyltransferase [Methanobacterium alcaliphilum]
MELLVEKTSQISGVVKAPPSKSYTHRAVIIASMADGKSLLNDPLNSEDTLASLESCRAFGSEINNFKEQWEVEGTAGEMQTPHDVIDVKNSGTTLRIMTSIAGLASNYSIFTGDSSLKTRPMQHLLDALKTLGVEAVSSRGDGKPPIIVKGGFKGGKTSIPGNVSSQFISSILIAGVLAENPVELEVTGEFISQPYVDMTRDVMAKFGVRVGYDSVSKIFKVNPQNYKSTDYTIEGDYSSASYLAGAAAILGSEITIKNLFKDSKQGDKLILDILSCMGAEINAKYDEVTVEGNGELQGIDIDLHNAPDLLPTMSVLGALAEGTTEISGVKHARFKETDRISTCAKELTKLGVDVNEKPDGMVINGGVKSGIVQSHGDHRLAMALSLIGLKVGIKIQNAEVYGVSFPNFPEVMNKLGCTMTLR